jgi:hypothetical protein
MAVNARVGLEVKTFGWTFDSLNAMQAEPDEPN